ncbi:beta-lactamase family protein [Muricauda sp. SCSIO 64092]|uniref:serine hydrolase domain-containing protein n=1 Tax=Allomuricauda sp. SCSIO 64092 TaxID=2908842 RepID=UPI001FF2F299|nr:serine hydrolase domain-containing protein [Muricauda sp. SCSIO 64092]UOY07593.1 beta-lactamase family protein [Muricauda sp. SCSIO 64092]
MKNSCFALIALLLLTSCSTSDNTKSVTKNTEQFKLELQHLKEYFHIPGLAVLVQKGDSVLYEDYFGHANVEEDIKVDSTTQFPIASITKVFAGVALFKLQEEGKLSFEDAINTYFDDPIFDDSIKIKHVLSHTSQGSPGENFYYSYRFGALTHVIEKASKTSFGDYIGNGIFVPLDLQNTFLLTDSTSVTKTMARPYNFDEQVVAGQVEYGASASAGIVSNPRDMAKFSKALDDNVLLDETSKLGMYTPFASHLPYGHGIFSQVFNGKKVLWAYGQYDSYSSLLLKVPEDHLSLIILANNNLMSDPARLIYGDGLSSLFTQSFLKNYVFDFGDMPLFESGNGTEKFQNTELHRKKLLAEALASSFMARFDDSELEKSKKLLRQLFKQYPDYPAYADLNLLHNLTFIKDVHFSKDLGPFDEFDPQIEAIANTLLKKDQDNPYVNIYMGTFHNRKGNLDKAQSHFETIANAKNFSPFWYTSEAKRWLEEHN